jgi:HrpA-like RNA helicase
VIEGETGCGKTTQVPKYILNAQPDSKIIVTQPRRLAAVMVAKRVAYETNSKLGERVGYHIGMDCCATDKTKITYVTNGIFLQKLTNDPDFLKSYTHFIFDEIHERGL